MNHTFTLTVKNSFFGIFFMQSLAQSCRLIFAGQCHFSSATMEL